MPLPYTVNTGTGIVGAAPSLRDSSPAAAAPPTQSRSAIRAVNRCAVTKCGAPCGSAVQKR
ncbi:hypothetical protein EDD93_4538 [Streptomyces sp. 840.1]|nr:hypothetical protein EDD93_4538 [Streptomyces sp. 840.1]